MNESKAKELLEKYRQGVCTDEERAMVENYFTRYIRSNERFPERHEWARVQRSMRNHVQTAISGRVRRRTPVWAYAAAAASVVLVATWLLYPGTEPVPATAVAMTTTPIDTDPGSDRAILMLSDGRQVKLDDVADGELANDAGVIINKGAEGQISYQAAASSDTGTTYHTLKTPRGGQFKLVLPDGTRVWLNAASTLKYPTHFSGKARRVELVGEAYFEVSRLSMDESAGTYVPFIVETDRQRVDVLGTGFNLNAYPDESAVKTTLLEGSVQVSSATGAWSQQLRPGEQAVLHAGALTTHAVDAEAAVAWKNDLFLFYYTDLPTIIRQIERWYDVEFEDVDLPESGRLYGEISRKQKLSVVLQALSQYTGFRFNLEGRRVAVTP